MVALVEELEMKATATAFVIVMLLYTTLAAGLFGALYAWVF